MMRNALPLYYGAPKASGCSIDSLTKPFTAKQAAQAFLHWRKKQLTRGARP